MTSPSRATIPPAADERAAMHAGGSTACLTHQTLDNHEVVAEVGAFPRVPFGRLVGVELRKMVDTRAGRWLLITVGLVLAAVMAAVLSLGETSRSFAVFLSSLSVPLVLLLPLVAILAATGEFSQRTALTTFAVEPRRTRVVLAKTVASLVVGLGAYVFCVALAAAGHAASIAWRGAAAAWSVDAGVLWGLGIVLVVGLLQGVAFGLALLNTPAAVCAYLILPTVWSMVVVLVPRLAGVAPWVDLGAATAPLFEASRMVGTDWAHLASASALWVLLPWAIGLQRVLRRDIA